MGPGRFCLETKLDINGETKKSNKEVDETEGSVSQSGVNSLDILVGALAGLYSKKLVIQNDLQIPLSPSESGSLALNKTQEKAKDRVNSNEVLVPRFWKKL